MAMRMLRIVAVLGAVFSLGSCEVLQFVLGSVFPATATLLKAQADLSSQIPSQNGYSFNVRVVETPGYGYVIVAGSLPTTGNTAFIYDLDLNLKQTLTGLANVGVMTDLSGNIVIGNTAFVPSSLAPASETPAVISRNAPGGSDGFLGTDAGGASWNIANFGLSGSSTLTYTYYSSGWTATSPTSFPALSATLSNLTLDAILDDGNPSGNVYFVISPSTNSSSATCYFVTIPKSGIATSTPSGAGYLDTAPKRDNLDKESFGFAQGSIFAYDTGSFSFVRIDPSTGLNQSSFLSSTDPSSTRFAYRISGGSFYGFDATTRVLTKYTAWW